MIQQKIYPITKINAMKRNTFLMIVLFTGLVLMLISCKTASNKSDETQAVYDSEITAEIHDTVPSVYTLTADVKRIVVVRLKNKTDLLEGLNEAVQKEGIKNGVILHGIGSVISYHIHSVSETTEFPTVNALSDFLCGI